MDAESDERALFESALEELISWLQARNYVFICPTPETHEKVLRRLSSEQSGKALNASTLVDLWGWSLSTTSQRCEELAIPSSIREHLLTQGSLFRPLVRVSSLYPGPAVGLSDPLPPVLYAHSSWPTTQKDSVFFGPDTYRFLTFLTQALSIHPPREGQPLFELALDIGTGAGAGAIHIANLRSKQPTAHRSYLVRRTLGFDINPKALSFARVNQRAYTNALITNSHPARGAPPCIDFRLSNLFAALTPDERSHLDLVISNPPYIAMSQDNETLYASGGASAGLSLPWAIVCSSLEHLQPGGLFIMYTGVPISIQGKDPLFGDLKAEEGGLDAMGGKLLEYRTIDVDVFGDDLLDHAGPYGNSSVGRIAVVGLVVRKV